MDNKEEEIKEVLKQCELEENSNNEINKNKDKMSESFKGYIVSFIPYLILLFFAINGVDFNAFGTTRCYGIDAIIILLMFWFPVYLGLFIFQLIYTIRKYKTFTKIEKTISKTIIILFTVTFLVLFYSWIYNNVYG